MQVGSRPGNFRQNQVGQGRIRYCVTKTVEFFTAGSNKSAD